MVGAATDKAMTQQFVTDASLQTACAEHAAARECAAIAADLERLKGLIAEAGDKLAASFAVIGETVPHTVADEPSRRRVERAVADAVTALQFQDMATQLTQHAQRRLAVLRDALKALSQENTDPLLATTRMQPVRQTGLGAGSIDLF
ncbi:MAG: hypothetical protein OHK0044_24360 [Burkholderiaceae bacterium]